MPAPTNNELYVLLVKELIERITTTQERLTEIAADHEKRLTTIELGQQHEQQADERRGLRGERLWAILFAASSIVYTALYLLELLRIFPA